MQYGLNIDQNFSTVKNVYTRWFWKDFCETIKPNHSNNWNKIYHCEGFLYFQKRAQSLLVTYSMLVTRTNVLVTSFRCWQPIWTFQHAALLIVRIIQLRHQWVFKRFQVHLNFLLGVLSHFVALLVAMAVEQEQELDFLIVQMSVQAHYRKFFLLWWSL